MAESGAGAQADAKVGLAYDPLKAAIDAEVGAFSGARAGFRGGAFPALGFFSDIADLMQIRSSRNYVG